LRHLISGAAGFIGSHLCDRLLADGHEVVGVDNFITGSRSNLEHQAGHARFRIEKCDVATSFSVDGVFDHVWHLASLASPKHYLAHPI
jgi:dTDP-glucose 4,6-dehydratase